MLLNFFYAIFSDIIWISINASGGLFSSLIGLALGDCIFKNDETVRNDNIKNLYIVTIFSAIFSGSLAIYLQNLTFWERFTLMTYYNLLIMICIMLYGVYLKSPFYTNKDQVKSETLKK